MKAKLGLIIFCLLLIGYVLTYSLIKNKKYDYVKQHGHFTTGIITTYGSLVKCDFYIDSVLHTKTIDEPYPKIVDGEKFKIYFNKKYPDIFYISFSEPIIDSTFMITKYMEIEKVNNDLVKYKFVINNDTYVRFQELNKDIKLDFTKYGVWYKKDNPKIAYLMIMKKDK